MTGKVPKTVRLAANRDAQIAEYAEEHGISQSDAFRQLLDRGLAAMARDATHDTGHEGAVTGSAQPSQSRQQPDEESGKNTLNARLIRSIQLAHRVIDHLDSTDTAEVFLSNPELCRECLRAVRYPVTVSCPYCPSEDWIKDGDVAGTNRQSYECKSCGRNFNMLTGTIFAGREFGLDEMCYMIRGMKKGKDPKDMSSDLDSTLRTVSEFVQEIQAIIDPEPD